MINISFFQYQLLPRQALNAVTSVQPRSGALLRVKWSDGRCGYADLHPWPELGDISLQEQLTDLRRSKISTQVEQSIWLASQDAHLRSEKKSIFDMGANVPNNFLIADAGNFSRSEIEQLKEKKFTTVKLKVGRNLSAESKIVHQLADAGFKLRLDFNGVATWTTFENFFKQFSSRVLQQIDYVEDPFPYSTELWQRGQKIVPLALDRDEGLVNWESVDSLPFSHLILKPAITDVDKSVARAKKHGLKLTVTSYMDHPVGVLSALGVAISLNSKYPHLMNEAGCMTHSLYQFDPFQAELDAEGPLLLGSKGTGVGFDHLLEQLPWQSL